MPSYLYYPQSSCSINDLAKTTCTQADAMGNYVKALCRANPSLATPESKLYNGRPYAIPARENTGRISTPILTGQEHATLSTLSHYAGGGAVMALSDLLWDSKLADYAGDMNTFGGAGIQSTARTANHLLRDIGRYDDLLKEYEQLKAHRAAPATLSRKERQLKQAFQKMNQSLNHKGQTFLHKHAFKTREVVSQTGKVARESIPISSHADVQKLSKLAKGARVLGPGVILLDGYFRTNKVVNMYKNNNPNWKREAVVQTAGLTMGVALMGLVTFGIMLSPMGLIVGIVAAGATAITIDKGAQFLAGAVYDGLTR